MLKKLLLTAICVISLIGTANADCGIGTYKENTKATISNEMGAKIYEHRVIDGKDKYVYTGKKLDKNIEVELYVDEVKIGDDYLINVVYDNDNLLILSKDLKLIKKENTLPDNLKRDKYYTITDTIVREGPGLAYDVVGTIKKDTNILYESKEKLDETPWIYVSDGKISGYAYFELCNSSDKENHIPVTIGEKVEGDYYYTNFLKSSLNLKYGDKLNLKYRSLYYKGEPEYYMDYMGENVKLMHSEIGVKTSDKLYVLKKLKENDDIELYKLTDNEKISNIYDYLKEGKSYKISYISDSNHIDGKTNFHIMIDNETYILKARLNYEQDLKDVSYFISSGNKEYMLESDLNLYNPFDMTKIIKTYKKGDKFSAYKIHIFSMYSPFRELYYAKDKGYFTANEVKEIRDIEEVFENDKQLEDTKTEEDKEDKKNNIIEFNKGGVALGIIVMLSIIILCQLIYIIVIKHKKISKKKKRD